VLPNPQSRASRIGWAAALLAGHALLTLTACNPDTAPDGAAAAKRNDLQAMRKTTITINDQPFEVWIAETPAQVQLGLMQVSEDEIAPLPDGTERGMLFVFAFEQTLSFWMRNTIIPLDIAFIRTDGQIVKTHTMAPLETRLYSSGVPALMALEVRAGTFHRLGIAEGDRVEIPQSVLKPAHP
jgi:uncharacterized membrane protein (UPF0127 family)